MLDGHILLAEAVSEFEKLYIKKALARNKEHLSKTAKALGIHRNTLSKRVADLPTAETTTDPRRTQRIALATQLQPAPASSSCNCRLPHG